MKKLRKPLSIILSLIMLMSMLFGINITSFAETSGEWEYELLNGTAVIIGYNGSETDVVIPSEIDGYIVTSIGNSAFYECTSLTSVTIPDSVTSIEIRAFFGCASLESVTIPDSVISIGNVAFYNTAYYDDENNWENGILYINNHLISVKKDITGDIGIRDGTKRIADYAFSECESLTSVTIPDSVTSIGSNAFDNCTSLTSATIGNSVTSIGSYAFYDCASLESVIIGDSVTSIGECAFYRCRSLTSITIPDSVTSIGTAAFYGCTSLTSITIPDSVISIGSNAFGFCTSLTSITIPDSVTSIGNYAFWGCASLVDIAIPDSVTTIGNGAFSDCTSLTSVTIPDSVTSIKDYAFDSCTSLTSITIPDSVTSIDDYAFYNCTSLTNITIPDSVTSIGKFAFCGCTSLINITIPDSVTTIGNGAFSRCASLESVTIPDGVTTIGDKAFFGCTSLVNITIPGSVTSIGDKAFFGCTSLVNITIPGSVTSIGNDAFYGCASLADITIPDSVTSIGTNAFYGCTSLVNITIPDSVTSIAAAFLFCTSLTGATIGNSVTSIENAFGFSYYGTYLTDITVLGNDTILTNSYIGMTRFKFVDTMAEEFSELNSEYINATIDCELGKISEDELDQIVAEYNEWYTAHVIELDELVANPDAVIRCYKGSKAEEYALENGITVVYLEECAHDYIVKTIKEVSCTEDGQKSYTCSICGDSYTEVIPATGHTDNDGDGICDVCGKSALEVIASGECGAQGDNVTWVLYEDGTLEISGTGDMADYEEGTAPWYEYRERITSVIIEEGVTSIGKYAFYGCSAIRSADLPDEIEIGAGAFYDCTSLTGIAVGGAVDESAFFGCTGLTTVSIANTVTSIDAFAFSCCTGIETVIIPEGVETIGEGAFESCYSLKTVKLPNSLKTIGMDAFVYCISLTNITIPANVENIGEAAFECCGLTDSTILGKDTLLTDSSIGMTWFNLTDATSNEAAQNFINLSNANLDYNNGKITEEEFSQIEAEYDEWYAAHVIVLDEPVVNPDAVIRCYKGSKAEEYALENGITVVYLDEDEPVHTHNFVGEEITPASCEDDGVMTYTCSCGESYTETLPALGHDWENVTIPSDCKTAGVSYDVCLNCGQTRNYTVLPLEDHTWGEWAVTTAPTCVSEGEKTRSCSVCGETETEKIGVIEHNYASDVTNPTCTAQGFTTHICSVCGDSYIDSYTDIIPHTPVTVEGKPATCEETGLTDGEICSVCGAVLTEQEITPALGHDWESVVIPSDCKTAGVSYDVCLNCGQTRNYAVLPLEEHTWGEWAVTTAPTCISEGEKTRSCSVCGETETEKIGVIEHNYVSEVTNPTCTAQGFTTHTCSVCGDSYIDSYTDIIPHTPVTVEGKPASCEETGLTDGEICSVCGAVLTEQETIPALGHDWESVVVPSDCKTAGVSYDVCLNCGQTRNYTVLPLEDHTWGEWTVTTAPTCVSEGEKTRTCTVCGETETEKIGVTEHNYVSEVTNPTCTAQGFTTHTCSVCGDSYIDSYTDIIPHTPVTVEGKPASCEETGLTDGEICSVCGAVLTEQETIPALGHDWGEWTVTKESTYMNEGERTAVCSVCGKTKSEKLDKLVPVKESVDEDTGVSVGFIDETFSGDIEINAVQEFDGYSFNVLNLEKGEFKSELYDITITKDGEKVQPSTLVLVRLPLPAGYNPDKTAVYYVSNTGALEKMNSYCENGYIYFEASHFSSYAIVDESEPASQSGTDCPFFNALIEFFYRLVSMITKLFESIWYGI